MATRRRTEGSRAFARVAPAAASNVPEEWTLADRWRAGSSEWRRERGEDELGAVPSSTFERLRERQAENLLRQLENLDVDAGVAASIASIDPDGSYAMILSVKGYNGVQRAKDVAFVGRGRALWERVAYIAGSEENEIVDVEFVELHPFADGYQGAYSLWKKDSVLMADGVTRFDGLGSYVRWRNKRDKAIGGRPKKRRGRMTYEQGSRAAKAGRDADLRARRSERRLRELRGRIKVLDASGAKGLASTLKAAAKQLERRIRAGRGKGKKR